MEFRSQVVLFYTLFCVVRHINLQALSFSSTFQYDFMERLDGKEKWSVVESPRERRSIQTLVQNEAVFVQYLDVGLWHLAFYNDGKDKEVVSFNTVVLGMYILAVSPGSL